MVIATTLVQPDGRRLAEGIDPATNPSPLSIRTVWLSNHQFVRSDSRNNVRTGARCRAPALNSAALTKARFLSFGLQY